MWEIQRLESLWPSLSGGNPGPAANLGSSPTPQSERRHGRDEGHGRANAFLDEKVEVRSFLLQAFCPNIDPFLDIQIPKPDAPFVYVTLTATTPWQDKPMTLDNARLLPTLASKIDNYGVAYPISRVIYAGATHIPTIPQSGVHGVEERREMAQGG
jgi:hypothetical protein